MTIPDKQDAPCASFALPGWQVLEVAGTDAGAFMQAQTMNDLRLLAPGQWQWNGWLNPKGRLLTLFMLAQHDAQRFWLVLPDEPAADLAAALRRFVFRSKLTLTARADLGASGTFAPPAQARLATFSAAGADAAVEFDLGGAGGARTLTVRPVAAGPSADPARDGDAQRWHAFDLAHGLPRLGAAQRGQWTPQMLSLQRLHAFSLKKGCYPGQEIVARTHFLGTAKRELVHVTGTALAEGRDIVAEGRVLGSLVSCAGTSALAVLALERPGTDWTCGDAACAAQPLHAGLER